jgi:hypothetical protein
MQITRTQYTQYTLIHTDDTRTREPRDADHLVFGQQAGVLEEERESELESGFRVS